MKVIDPAGQFAFELPICWGCDLQISHLIEVYFRRWDRPAPRIAVRVYSTAAPQHASDEDWRAAAEKRAGAPCTPMVVRGRAALRVDKKKEGEAPQRSAPACGRCMTSLWREGSAAPKAMCSSPIPCTTLRSWPGAMRSPCGTQRIRPRQGDPTTLRSLSRVVWSARRRARSRSRCARTAPTACDRRCARSTRRRRSRCPHPRRSPWARW